MKQVIEKYTCDKCGCDLNSNGINWKQPSTWKPPDQGRFRVSFNIFLDKEGGSRPDLCAFCAATLFKEFSEAVLAYALEPSL